MRPHLAGTIAIKDDPVTPPTAGVMGSALAGFTALLGSFDIWFWRDQSDEPAFILAAAKAIQQ